VAVTLSAVSLVLHRMIIMVTMTMVITTTSVRNHVVSVNLTDASLALY